MTKTLIELTGKKPTSFLISELINDIFPEKHHYIRGYLGDIIKISFPSDTSILKTELDKLNKIMTITLFSYDRDMDRIVIMGYINGA